ncbi:MAG: TonB family protein [Candidatus Celaenobacter antarcticus]|nr:TonB family protein [Candidatus Celaenobacter antarcticus]
MTKTISILIFSVLFLISTVFALDTMPDFTIEDINGDQIDSEELLNKKAVIIDFWAKWCSPCKKALPHLSDMQEKYEDLVNVVCITIDKARNEDKAKSYVKSRNFKFITLFDPNKDVSKLFNVNTIPRTFIINKNGEIVFRHEGYTQGDENELEAELRKVIYKDITIEELNELFPPEELPEPITYVSPVYPPKAHDDKVEADIILDLEIMEDGTVGDVYLISACKDTTYGFERAAINAVWQWTFEPVTVDKEPVKTRLLYPIRFRIEKQ